MHQVGDVLSNTTDRGGSLAQASCILTTGSLVPIFNKVGNAYTSDASPVSETAPLKALSWAATSIRIPRMSVDASEQVRCLECGYCLGNPTRPVCPECGRPFDPDDPRTFRTIVFPWPAWSRRSPRLWHLRLVIAFCLVVLKHPSEPSLNIPFLPACFAILMLPVVILDYATRAAAAAWTRKHALADTRAPGASARWRWWVAPACLALLTLAIDSDLPLRVRFALSEPALAREYHARAKLFTIGRHSPTGWIGLYHIRYIEFLPDGSLAFVCDGYKGHRTGFIYSADGSTPRGLTKQLTPNWHVASWR